ncbi:hypothetical protein EVAR_30347_1 [Eumeta japonica]|uniref:Uncharacterized protein n=1 Tax=Eumeta variegata TaxID=151549 RepID=A0A4C1W9C1_EUMVA|nr:hypothetical protein EVAR_30347_1 [Eumeta japonica]
MRRGFNNDPLGDLELELELLKRKRQVLQEKRQIMEEQREFDRAKHQHSPWASGSNQIVLPFQQTSYTSNVGFGNSKNFQSHSNSSGKQGGGRGSSYSGRNFGTKRPAPNDSSWNPPEKRFAGSFRGGNAKKPKQTYVPKPFMEKPTPLSDTPSKSQSSTPQKKADQSLVLKSNAPISNQLMGRMELLLGHILKRLKSICQEPPIKKTTFSNEALFSVKQEIRARIQNALLDKEVLGNISYNLEHYRKMYPIETDQELIDIMLSDVTYPPTVDKAKIQEKEVEQLPVMRPDAELFKKYLKYHFDAALKTKLSEMFEKLKKIYDEENKKPDEVEKTLTDSDKVTESEMVVIKETSSSEESEFEKKMEPLIRKKLFILLPQYKHLLRNLLKTPQLLNGIIKQYGKGKTPFVNEEPTPPDSSNKQKTSKPLTSTYVARVVGHPCLPPKDLMKDFLKAFDPVSIKKYVGAHNVLFIELPDAQCLNALVVASGTTIDNVKIVVKRQNTGYYTKKLSNSTTDSTEMEKTNGEAKIKQDDGDTKQENASDTQDDDVVNINDTNVPEVATKNVSQSCAVKEISENPTNDYEMVDDVDINNMGIDLNEAGNIKNELDEGNEDASMNDNNLNKIDKDKTGGIENESNEEKNIDGSLNVNKDEMNNTIGSMTHDQQTNSGAEVAIKGDKHVEISTDSVKNNVTKETVINDKVIDIDDEGWNTDAKDDWADLKEKDSTNEMNNEPSTPVRVTRSSKRLSAENK